MWLTQKPKSEAGLRLLSIVSRLSQIKTHHQAQIWMKEVHDWYVEHEAFVQEKSYSKTTGRYWYKHKLVRRCFIMIKNAFPNLFLFLFNSRIPKSTNGLESFFGHLKSHLLLHRGMTKEHRKSFIKWYLYFKNNQQVFLAIRDTNKNREPCDSLSYCISINPIASELLLSRAHVLFGFTLVIKQIYMTKSPTIFGTITFFEALEKIF